MSEQPPELCCARCRRGMPSMGVMPCGLGGLCKCHLRAEGEHNDS